jgi:RNA polymerase sigma factor (sigma-70 family)
MSYSSFDDIYLLQLLKIGNREAFAEIYNRYWKLIYKTAHNIILDRDVTKDAVQEVFVALWQRREESNIQILKPYLQQSVRFQVLKAIRAQKTDEEFYIRLATVTADIIYDDPLLFKEQELLLKETLDALPDDSRLIFKLSREDHLTYKQIAIHLNISEKTVEKKMSFCLKQIRQVFENGKVILLILLLALCARG